ncbi:hypothetical protein PHLCEN_2v10612 [Hermanssonia centrifuga]|uniref:NADH dehydrogenase [ubiquinone] 1 alpha subcomplex assembly factor 3 n=1 Tax=Hermanssonia centrifuga TaxID=98765 RepID=A0A2R6NMT0_9APHY|nr:hypothetical protein PHLCEN_2v10612 [Hermanssonia centrifuga]
MFARALQSSAIRSTLRSQHKAFHDSRICNSALHNILAGGASPSTQVKTITAEGINLADGRIIPSSCIFLDGKVFLWQTPETFWDGWGTEHFEVFDAVVPKPEILLLGTGKRLILPPPSIRQYLTSIGIQIDVMDTRNACSTYNLLAEEGRRVAAALIPLSARSWKRTQ